MPTLWTFDEFDAHDHDRADQLYLAPQWQEIVESVRRALRMELERNNARFGMDESSRDSRDLRGVVQFKIGKPLFDWFFNGRSGYRAQFRIGRENGLAMNAHLIRELAAELAHFSDADILVHMYNFEFSYKESRPGKVHVVAKTLSPELSKAWACEKLMSNSGQIEHLFVSRTGPRLLIPGANPWSSLYPEDADGWLDIKGAFVPPTGQPYALKLPETRAADLEERGSA